MKKKTVALLMACVMALGVAVGGTMAWLTDKTDSVKNVFTTSNIDITLTETPSDEVEEGEDWAKKMIPGFTIDKDPVVTVGANSEDCWLFIKVEKSGGEVKVDGETCSFDDFIEYEIDPNNWNQLTDADGEDVEGVYVGVVPCENITADRSVKVLLNNKVHVKGTVTKEMMDGISEEDRPKLTFTAYAHQLYKNNTEKFTAAEAWASISGTTATP